MPVADGSFRWSEDEKVTGRRILFLTETLHSQKILESLDILIFEKMYHYIGKADPAAVRVCSEFDAIGRQKKSFTPLDNS